MTTTIRLNDLQLVLLSSAAARDNGSLIPLPANCTQDRARIGKAFAALLRRGLVSELTVTDRSLGWREQDQQQVGLFITDAGRSAIGSEPKHASPNHTAEAGAAADELDDTQSGAANEQSASAAAGGPVKSEAAPLSGSKIASVVSLLERKEGATLAQLVEATGWLPHTTRAALTGLRKKGRSIAKTKRGDVTCYRLEAGTSQ